MPVLDLPNFGWNGERLPKNQRNLTLTASLQDNDSVVHLLSFFYAYRIIWVEGMKVFRSLMLQNESSSTLHRIAD